MSLVEKFQTVIVFLSVVIGFFLGQIDFLADQAGHLVIPALFVMLFGLFLSVPLKDLRKSFKNVRFAFVVVVINFVWTPVLVWALGGIFLSAQPALWIGFIMLMVTPCTDWYLVFTGIAKGNVPLSTSILPLNLILQVVLLPVYLFIFADTSGSVNLNALFHSILIILILPFLLAQFTKYILFRCGPGNSGQSRFCDFFSNLQTPMLALAIMAMFASQGRNLLANIHILYWLLLPILIFYAINFILAQIVSKKLKFNYEDTASLTITTIAKNSPMTLGIAVMAFPNEPIIALAMIIEPLVELPVMVLVSRLLLTIKSKRPASL